MMLNLRPLRLRANLSQAKCGQLIGVGQSAYSEWERGISLPSADKLPKLADTFGVSIDALYGRKASR